MDGKGKQGRVLMGRVPKKEVEVGEGSSDDKQPLMGCEEDDYNENNKKKKMMITVGGGGGATKVSSVGGGGSGSGAMRLCQAEKCPADLSDAKAYHRRHKVCEQHAKAQVVLVGGIRQRFCQQCSRFHEVSEFDETKRSCRRRLAGHNERRRKNAAESQPKATDTLELKDMVCGQVDDRGGIKLTIQENATYKHYQIS